MSTELKKEIVDLKIRVDNLTIELKILRSLLSKISNRKNENPYKYYGGQNRYSNSDENSNNGFNRNEKRETKINRQPNLGYEKFLQRQSQFYRKVEESSQSKKSEPMLVNKSMIQKRVKSNRAEKTEKMEADKSLNIGNAGQRSKPNKILVKPTFEKKREQLRCEQPKKQASTNHYMNFRRDKDVETKVKNAEKVGRSNLSEESFTSSIFLQRRDNLLSFERHDMQTSKKLTGLIDIGTSNNYISRKNANHGQLIRLSKPIRITTRLGKLDVNHYVKINLFSHSLNFLIVDDLGDFDFSLGMNGLRKLNAKLDLMSFKLTYRDRNKFNI